MSNLPFHLNCFPHSHSGLCDNKSNAVENSYFWLLGCIWQCWMLSTFWNSLFLAFRTPQAPNFLSIFHHGPHLFLKATSPSLNIGIPSFLSCFLSLQYITIHRPLIIIFRGKISLLSKEISPTQLIHVVVWFELMCGFPKLHALSIW